MSTQDLRAPSGELGRAGTRLRYWLHGPPEGPLVVCTHGLSLDHRAFDDQIAALVGAGYRVLTWDIRGHGASQPMGPEMSIAAAVDDLLALLDAVGANRVVLVGESFGGMITQDALSGHPERVAAMVVIGAPELGDRPGPVMRTLQRLRIQMIKLWPDALLRKVFATMVTKHPQVRDYVAEATRQLSKPAFVAVSAAAMDGHLREADAPTHGRPLLLVHGTAEERPVARAMLRWAQRDPAARHEVIEGGHLVHQENPSEFNAILLDFLEDHAPTG